jgi:hypothetical protein
VNPAVGTRPSSTKTFKFENDVRELCVYDVYAPVLYSFAKMVTGIFDHTEYVAL